MKSVLISIQPKLVEKIANGEKTIEVRKTRPKLETPFKCYIYRITEKVENIVEEYDSNFNLLRRKKTLKKFNGEVIGVFVCDEVYEWKYDYCDGVDIDDDLILDTCLDREDINIYAKGKTLYGWHISDLKIYDKPKELGNFFTPMGKRPSYMIERPPQSYMYVEEL